jgi:hypothetical protein
VTTLRALAADRYASPVRAGAVLACAIYVVALTTGLIPLGVDAHSYWNANPLQPYNGLPVFAQDGYFYSPAFAQALGPLHALPWPIFAGLWSTALCAVLYWLSGRWFGFIVLVPFVAIEIAMGNIHILLAAAIAAGFRYPVLWSFVLLTKITPGIGLLWFFVRREWRSLGLALGATLVIATLSFVVAPQAWTDWLTTLKASLAQSAPQPVPVGLVPLPVRLVIAAGIVMYGARTNRRWVVPVAAVVALPVVYVNSLAILVAVPFLWEGRDAKLPRHFGRRRPAPADVATASSEAPATI